MDSERLSPKALPRVKKRETPITTKQLVDLLSKVTCFAKFNPEQMVQVMQSLLLYYSLVDKRRALSPKCRFTDLASAKWPYCSQSGHIESDALK